MTIRKLINVLAGSVLLALGPALPASAALVASYDFNESSGTTVHPTTGSVTGSLLGGASFVSGGVEGGAVSIASGGLVDFGPNLFPTGAFSVQAWVKTTDTGPLTPLAYHTSTIVAGYILAINDIHDGCGSPPGSAEFYVAYPCSGSSAKVVNDGKWHQLVGVYDGSRSSIYVDGQFQSISGGGNPLNTPPASTHLLVGGIMVGPTPTNVYTGLVDGVKIYDNALTASDVNALYTSMIPEPSSTIFMGFGLAFLAAASRRTLAAHARTAPVGSPSGHTVCG